ncbi:MULTISPECIES: HEAT repeat domain-containing protein [unclassified Moorena]|uniref:HEAT repeat domain-containing protein n=1 Tax=unclassified Moorena TaxID=2683338 RepID=UPI0014008848|nr:MULTISPECIES: HEAT repeat domain-containing protein [unclassified Moorena]NEO17325.1 hypothetical protein [Moorena sp. SIO3E8]NEQ03881.1 hypothetical protein [Moorena sp. SIO3F7]
MIPIIVAILAAAVVGAIVFFILQNKLDFLSEQTDRKLEVFQNKYEARIQQSSQALQESYREQLNQKIAEVKDQAESSAAAPVQSLQENYQAQLTQTTNELKQQLDASLLESVQSSEARYQEQLTQATHELKEELESNFRNELQSLEAKYQADLELAHQKIAELEQAHKSPIPDQVKNLEKTEDSSGETGNELVELLEEAETNQDEPQQVVKDEILPEPSQPEQPMVTETPIITDQPSQSDQDLEDEILPEPSQPEQPMVTETPIITDQPSQSDQDLDETITALENYAQASDIPQLSNYINHPESLIRGSIASALGKIAAAQGFRAEIQQAIPLMGKLIQDPQPSVRKSAVEALSNIKSEKVIPLLERALRDPDSDVVKSASAGISQFKSYRRTPKPKAAKKTVKPSKR